MMTHAATPGLLKPAVLWLLLLAPLFFSTYGFATWVTSQRSDSGSGLPEEELEAVFDPFVRLETSRSRETGGAGLGLTIARALAEKDGARLLLRNHPQGGLEAVVEWPATLRVGTWRPG